LLEDLQYKLSSNNNKIIEDNHFLVDCNYKLYNENVYLTQKIQKIEKNKNNDINKDKEIEDQNESIMITSTYDKKDSNYTLKDEIEQYQTQLELEKDI